MLLKKILTGAALLGLLTVSGPLMAGDAKACVGDNCELRCWCDSQCDQNYPIGGQDWSNCRANCHFWYECNIEYLCP